VPRLRADSGELGASTTDGTLELLNQWVELAQDTRPEALVFPSEKMATPLSADNSEDMRDGQAIDGLTIRNPFSRQTYSSAMPDAFR